VTLVVSVHERDPISGELGPDLVTGTGAELAGFEAWRSSVYGSAAVRRRGSQFLPRLAGADLLLEGDDLIAFQKECAVLLREIVELSADLDVDAETLRFRLSNIAAATEQAIAIGGVVWIS
jgi:hypothetical protein